jgi:hypothetical protein
VSRIGRGCAEADRPARAAWAAVRLLVDVAISFSGIVVRRFWFGATMEVGGSGRSMMMSAGAGAASYGVIDNRSENLQH